MADIKYISVCLSACHARYRTVVTSHDAIAINHQSKYFSSGWSTSVTQCLGVWSTWQRWVITGVIWYRIWGKFIRCCRRRMNEWMWTYIARFNETPQSSNALNMLVEKKEESLDSSEGIGNKTAENDIVMSNFRWERLFYTHITQNVDKTYAIISIISQFPINGAQWKWQSRRISYIICG